jgi:membrane-bound lytic murein transglycosylase A
LQIQGSGQVELESGERMRFGYADQNGHPYRSLGRYFAMLAAYRVRDPDHA